MLDSHRACISSCVNVCVYAGLTQNFYILLCECVFPCWTPTELVYPLERICVSMLDSHRACISSTSVIVCFHAELPQSLYILLSEYVFQCWTPTELVYPLVLMCVSRLASHKASIYSCV